MTWGSCHHHRRLLWVVLFKTRSHKTETAVTNATSPPSIILLTKPGLCAFGPKRRGSTPSGREVEWDGERLGLDARVTTAEGAPHHTSTSPTTARVTPVLHTLDDIHIPTSHFGRSTALLSPQLGGVDDYDLCDSDSKPTSQMVYNTGFIHRLAWSLASRCPYYVPRLHLEEDEAEINYF